MERKTVRESKKRKINDGQYFGGTKTSTGSVRIFKNNSRNHRQSRCFNENPISLLRSINVKKILFALTIIFIIIMILRNPPRYIESTMNGLLVFANSVLPALFPFFFFTRLLTAIGMAESIGSVFKLPLRKLYNAPPESGYIFFMSIMSGYPVGARLVSDFYTMGAIDEKEAKVISSFASTSGPIFILGTIAGVILKSPNIGYIILISHILGAMLNGLIYRRISKNKTTANDNTKPLPKKTSDNILEETITSSVISILVVGGYIALFYLIGDIMSDIGLIDFFADILGKILPLFGINGDMARGIVFSLFEVTRGAIEISATPNIDIKEVIPIITFLVSLGGLSITFQSLTYLKSAKISFPFYFLTKLTHAVISALIAFFAVHLLL